MNQRNPKVAKVGKNHQEGRGWTQKFIKSFVFSADGSQAIRKLNPSSCNSNVMIELRGNGWSDGFSSGVILRPLTDRFKLSPMVNLQNSYIRDTTHTKHWRLQVVSKVSQVSGGVSAEWLIFVEKDPSAIRFPCSYMI
jgi:hypothetical protein